MSAVVLLCEMYLHINGSTRAQPPGSLLAGPCDLDVSGFFYAIDIHSVLMIIDIAIIVKVSTIQEGYKVIKKKGYF